MTKHLRDNFYENGRTNSEDAALDQWVERWFQSAGYDVSAGDIYPKEVQDSAPPVNEALIYAFVEGELQDRPELEQETCRQIFTYRSWGRAFRVARFDSNVQKAREAGDEALAEKLSRNRDQILNRQLNHD